MISYIIKVLQTEDSVFVNELGLFSKHYVPAHIDRDSLIPPHIEVTLDTSNYDHVEMFFTKFVSQEKQCSMVEAAEAITQWVNNLKNALESNKSIFFEQFGTFSKSDKGNITYSCCHIDLLNVEFEGMKPVSLTSETVEEKEPVEKQPVEVQKPVEEPVSVTMQESVPEPKPEKKKRNLIWLFILIVVIAAAILIYLFKAPIQSSIHRLLEKMDKTEQIAEPADVQPAETAVPEEEFAPESDAAKEETIVEEEAAGEEMVAKKESATYLPEVVKTTVDGKYQYIRFEDGHFYVIAGSFKTEKGLENLVRQNRLDSYHPTFVLQEGVSHIRVCIGIFDTEKEALAFAKNTNLKCWVLK